MLKSLRKEKRNLEYVFCDKRGKQVKFMHLTERHFKKACERAEVKRIRFHDLRTTFASNYVMNGGDIFTLSKILGHSSVEMTQKRYAHLHSSFMKKESNIINFSGNNSGRNSPDLMAL